MVNRPAASEAAEYAREHPELAIGLHFEARRWRVRRRPWSLIWTERALQRVVERDVASQLARFRALIGRDPSHIDSHKHRHRVEPLRSILLTLARELGVPLRHYDPRVQFCGAFYGHDGRGRPSPDAITPDALVGLLTQVSAGATELAPTRAIPRVSGSGTATSACRRCVRCAILGFERRSTVLASCSSRFGSLWFKRVANLRWRDRRLVPR